MVSQARKQSMENKHKVIREIFSVETPSTHAAGSVQVRQTTRVGEMSRATTTIVEFTSQVWVCENRYQTLALLFRHFLGPAMGIPHEPQALDDMCTEVHRRLSTVLESGSHRIALVALISGDSHMTNDSERT